MAGPCANVSYFLWLLSHLLHVAEREFNPLIVFQTIIMPVHEFPVERREWASVVANSLFVIEPTALAVVAHLVDVIAAGTVRLCADDASFPVLAHAERIRK